MEETETRETNEEVEKPASKTSDQADLLGMTSSAAGPTVGTNDLLGSGAAPAPEASTEEDTAAEEQRNDFLNMNGHHKDASASKPEQPEDDLPKGGLLINVPKTTKTSPIAADPFATTATKDPFAATPAADLFAVQPSGSVDQASTNDPFLVNQVPVPAACEEVAEPPEHSKGSADAENVRSSPKTQKEPLQLEQQQAELQPSNAEPKVKLESTEKTSATTAAVTETVPESPVQEKPPVDEAKVAAVMAIPPYVVERFSQDFPMNGRSREECIRQDPVAFHKCIVRSVLQTYDPNRTALVDKLFIKYRGKENQIVQKMIQKYKIKPEEKKQLSDDITTSDNAQAVKPARSEGEAPLPPAETQVNEKDGSRVEEKKSEDPQHEEAREPEPPAEAPAGQAPASNAPSVDESHGKTMAESDSAESEGSNGLSRGGVEQNAAPVVDSESTKSSARAMPGPIHVSQSVSNSVSEVAPAEIVSSESTPDVVTDSREALEPTVVEIPPRSVSARSSSAPSTPAKDHNQEEDSQRPGMSRARSVPEVSSPPKPVFDESVIMDLQNALEAQVTLRNEAEERAVFAETRVVELEGVVKERDQLQKELEQTKASLVSMTSDRSSLELELAKLREVRDEFERKETVLSNRLNAAKKKEGVKANEAKRLEERAKALETVLEATKKELEGTTKSKASVERDLESKTTDYEARLQQAEHSLSEERRLNDDRKKKMKAFVESKQEELRETKAQGDELTLELSQTNRSLREHHNRWKQLHAQWVQSQTRNRELQRDLNKLKKEQDTIQRKGGKLEIQMARSAKESEEHKNKRLTAKNELMTVLQTLEIEREVASKLCDSIKFTFTPKALSQQQLLKESLRDFERELVQLSTRLNRPLPPAPERPELFALVEDDGSEGPTDELHQQRQSRSQLDTTHLLKNLEDETQRVSQCIMALTNSIERMHIVLAGAGERNCTSVLAELFAGAAAATSDETTSMTGNRPTPLGRRYGHVPQH